MKAENKPTNYTDLIRWYNARAFYAVKKAELLVLVGELTEDTTAAVSAQSLNFKKVAQEIYQTVTGEEFPVQGRFIEGLHMGNDRSGEIVMGMFQFEMAGAVRVPIYVPKDVLKAVNYPELNDDDAETGIEDSSFRA